MTFVSTTFFFIATVLTFSICFVFVFHSIQDIAILFNLIIILLMLFNTYVFQVGLVAILLERFRTLFILSALYLTFTVTLHSWLLVCQNTNKSKFRSGKTLVTHFNSTILIALQGSVYLCHKVLTFLASCCIFIYRIVETHKLASYWECF